MSLKPGQSVGWHSTGQNEESLVILAGKGEALIAGQPKREIAAKQVFYVPPATQHNIMNSGSQPLEYVYVVAPAAEKN
ncbi:MAG: cupin domain-containing protein [Acidobacteriaceae bacterium]|nr:cupin domain-containing protein [Acidobacteriaceae bacterium]